jgi:hypothetical protein
MKRLTQWALTWLLVASAVVAMGAEADFVEKVASLVDPAKLTALGKRGANPRVHKYVAQLADARTAGFSPKRVATKALTLAGVKGSKAKLTAEAMTRNLAIAERLGCLDQDGLQDMRRGQAPTIRRGPYKEDQLSVDHIIPRKVAPELDNAIANLELMPLRMNEGKNDSVGARQKSLAKKLNKAGLLSDAGLKTVLKAP